jgi:hypothetical protein
MEATLPEKVTPGAMYNAPFTLPILAVALSANIQTDSVDAILPGADIGFPEESTHPETV